LFKPEDPLAPPRPAFKEAWHAQVLALADTFVKAGYFTANDWAETLGAALAQAEAQGAADTEETYYTCALSALEALSQQAGIAATDLTERKADWEAAYLRTPHGKPVVL
jgi:nitrile hydratase accessory protein